MKAFYVNQIEANQLITTSFLVGFKEIRQKKTGDPYLSLMLGDRTGDLDAKMWDNVAEVMDTFDRGALLYRPPKEEEIFSLFDGCGR